MGEGGNPTSEILEDPDRTITTLTETSIETQIGEAGTLAETTVEEEEDERLNIYNYLP